MKFLILLFILINLYAQNINNLLEKLYINDDLSKQTVKENGGYVYIITRKDLDKIKPLNLKEILEQIPFIRYDENTLGLTDPFFRPYQFNNPSYIKVYLNNTELTLPYGGNIIQLLGQLNINYIDHIEIYMGLPSFEISEKPSMTVIKIYTKKGYRENSSTLNLLYGNRGYYQNNITSGYGDEIKSYFVYGDIDNIKRKNYTYNNYNLNRNTFAKQFFGNIEYKKINFYLFHINNYTHTFITNGFKIAPINPHIKDNYNLFHIDYQTFINLSFNYQNVNTYYYNKNGYIIGIIPNTYTPYNQYSTNITQKKLTFKATKKLIFDKNSLFLLYKFEKDNIHQFNEKINNIPTYNDKKYKIYSYITGIEYTKLLNKKNLINFSITNIKENHKNIKKFNNNLYRIGYIFHNNKYTLKTFLFKGNFLPTLRMLLSNPNLKSEKTTAYSFKIKTNNKYSLLFGHTIIKNFIITLKDGTINIDKSNIYDSISLRKIWDINEKNKIVINPWRLYATYKYNNEKTITDGINLSFYNQIKNISFYNFINYYNNYKGNEGINYNVTISYKYKQSEIYFKGVNLLNKDVTTDYYLIDPTNNTKDEIKNVDVNERIITIGFRWEF